LRRRFMMRRATAICCSKSGSAVVSLTPSGMSMAYSVSPLPTPSFVNSSFGRITPTELPIWVSFSAFMARSGRLR